MGLLRYLLAIAVVVAHSAPIAGLPLLGGGLAVKLFFLVSGFYMGLILSDKYRTLPGGTGLFYGNRFLRIFPLFWLVLAAELTLLPLWQATLPGGDPRWTLWREAWTAGGGGGVLLAAASQLALCGTEVFSLFSWSPERGWFWHDGGVPEGGVRGWAFLAMPHSWTLSCELLFYLLAPALSRLGTVALGLVLAGTILATWWLLRLLPPDLAEVAADFFGPAQMGFFLAGMLGHRIHAAGWFGGPRRILAPWIGFALVGALFAAILAHGWLATLSHRLSLWGLFALAALALPALFETSRRSRWDRAVGELSYPVYLVHLLAISFVLLAAGAQAEDAPFRNSPWFPIGSILLSTLCAGGLVLAFDRPLDRYRQRRVEARRGRETNVARSA